MLHTLGSPTMEMSCGSAPNSGFFVRHNPKRDQDPRACQLESSHGGRIDSRITQGFETCADRFGFGDLYSTGVLVSMCLMCLPREKQMKWKEIVGQERVEWENRLGRAHVLLVDREGGRGYKRQRWRAARYQLDPTDQSCITNTQS